MPKGLIDKDEDHRKAALREVLEETGYKCKAVARLTTPARYRTSSDGHSAWKNLTLYLMTPIEKVQEADWENDAFRWVPIDKVEAYAAKVELPLILEAIERLRA
jgi:8-oxo-dGTP pyrophosphatase MutT (NUDIX family)